MSAPNVAQIMFRNVVLWFAPLGTTRIADTTAYGTTWPSPWNRFGFTKDGLAVQYDRDELEIEVQEVMGPVKRIAIGEKCTFGTRLAEVAPGYMYITTSSGIISSVPAAVGQPARSTLTMGGQGALREHMWGFEGCYRDAAGTEFPMRWYIWKGTSKVTDKLVWERKGSPGIAFEIAAMPDHAKAVGQQLFQWDMITAAALPAP